MFLHDCDKCIFLGTVVISEQMQDLYYCPNELGGPTIPTIIARWSDEGGDYSSGLCFGESTLVRHVNGDSRGNAGLMVAYTLAMANGLDVTDRMTVDQSPIIDKIKTYRRD